MISRESVRPATHPISHSASMQGQSARLPRRPQRIPVIYSATIPFTLSTRSFSSKEAPVFSQNSPINTYTGSLRNRIQAFPWSCFTTTYSSLLTSSETNIKIKIYPQSSMHGSRSSVRITRMRSCSCVMHFHRLRTYISISTRFAGIRRMSWEYFQRRLRNWIGIQWIT